MNQVATGLGAAVAIAGMGALAGLVAPARWRSAAAGAATTGIGLAGTAAGLAAVSGTSWQAHFPDLLPLAGVSLVVDALAGWFLLLVGAVSAVVGVYTIGYAGRGGHGPASRTALAVLPVFVAAMLLVPAAGSVSTFLLAWELMAVTSLLLVLAEHRHSPAVRTAGLWYAAMTQAGFVAVLLGLAWLAAAGGESFADIRAAGPELSPVVSGGVFLLCLAGFASKAGAVPLHPWLPRAHAEAPSHVSALMSAAMVKLGVYGIVRVGFDLLGGGPQWWWLLLGAFGVVSALYGILQAAVATDLKRLLAFSTSENVGLILLGLAVAGLWANAGQPAVAGVALAAALLHAANHAGFKTLLFCGAGSVLRATGTRDLDQLGGLSRRMPATTLLFTVGALGAAALPPGNGFVSEWLLLQALLHQAPAGGTVLTVAAPAAVAVVALTAGVGVATYVKALGTGFLARPRSTAAAQAVESPRSMVAGMGLAAVVCGALAIAPAVAAPALDRIATGLHAGEAPLEGSGVEVRLAGIASTISPLWIAVGVVGLAVGVAAVARVVGRARRRAVAWDCGDGPLTPRMEYTATSFAEPLQRVFDNVLAPEQDVDVTHPAESAYLVRSVQYRRRLPDRVEARLYQPLITAADRVGRAARRLATGSVHRYLAYMLTALVAVLVAGVPVSAWVMAAVQAVLVAGAAPLLIGFMRAVRARLEGRAGGRIAQPWRDLRKQLRKEPITPADAGVFFTAAPLVLMATSVLVAAAAPYLSTRGPLSGIADLIVVVGLLLLGTVALALAGLDTGTAFGGMGASREMTIAALVEPTLLLSVFALSTRVGSTDLGAIVAAGATDPARVFTPASALAAAALAIATLAEAGRLPVDNPATHLELTMVHEAMILEYAGRDLALVEWASAMRLTILLGLLANLFIPWGVAGSLHPVAVAVGAGVFVAKLAVLGGLLAAGEVFVAKLRLFRVPELLAGSFVLGLLAVVTSTVLA